MFVFGQEILFLSGKSQEILRCDVCGNHDTSWGSEYLINEQTLFWKKHKQHKVYFS